MIGAITFPVGFFLLGWTSSPSIHWFPSILGLVLIGMSFLLIFQAGINYLLDAYTKHAVSAVGTCLGCVPPCPPAPHYFLCFMDQDLQCPFASLSPSSHSLANPSSPNPHQFTSLHCLFLSLPLPSFPTAANTFMRSIFAAALPLVAQPLFKNLGVDWACTLLGCIALLLAGVPFTFYHFGPRLRAMSSYAAA
jgi:hypothetical protein